MKNYWIIPALTVLLMMACKGKKETKEIKEEGPISAVSIIKGQVKKLDSSMYAFMKLERNGNKTDTTYLNREEVRKLAEPFLSLPDIAEKMNFNKYTEERLIDAQQSMLNITSTLKDGEAGEIQKQIMVVGLGDDPSGNVQSIFIDRTISSGDSTIEQKLFWQIDKYFTIGKIVSRENEPEKTYYTRVEWK